MVFINTQLTFLLLSHRDAVAAIPSSINSRSMTTTMTVAGDAQHLPCSGGSPSLSSCTALPKPDILDVVLPCFCIHGWNDGLLITACL